MFATIDINPLHTLLADKHFYLVCCKSGGPQITESSLGITWIINKSDDLIGWIGNEIGCLVFVNRRPPCRRTMRFDPLRFASSQSLRRVRLMLNRCRLLGRICRELSCAPLYFCLLQRQFVGHGSR